MLKPGKKFNSENMNYLLACWMAAQIRDGDAGASNSVTPKGSRACSIAHIDAAMDPPLPASPQPFTPRGLVVAGTLRVEKLISQRSSALGMQ